MQPSQRNVCQQPEGRVCSVLQAVCLATQHGCAHSPPHKDTLCQVCTPAAKTRLMPNHIQAVHSSAAMITAMHWPRLTYQTPHSLTPLVLPCTAAPQSTSVTDRAAGLPHQMHSTSAQHRAAACTQPSYSCGMCCALHQFCLHWSMPRGTAGPSCCCAVRHNICSCPTPARCQRT
jgi:hypothetical protein